MHDYEPDKELTLIGIVIVAHSQELADGICTLASQMSTQSNPPIAAAGGLDDGGLGTSFEKIQRAVDVVYSDDGVLILMDLGSAVMTTQMVLEALPPERRSRIRLSNAPLVEGAIAAAVAASLGDDLDRVQHAAETALEMPKIPRETPLAPPVEATIPTGPSRSIELVVPNPIGLHARPAVLFVQTAAQFTAHITVQNVTHNRQIVDAKSMMQVVSQGAARQGERIRIVAQGKDAAEAIAALGALVEAGFGEMEGVEKVKETTTSSLPPSIGGDRGTRRRPPPTRPSTTTSGRHHRQGNRAHFRIPPYDAGGC